VNALATGKLETKRATALLYGLALASSNARGLYTEPTSATAVRTVEPSPEGLDLAAGITLDTEDLYQFNDEDEDHEDEDEDEEDEQH